MFRNIIGFNQENSCKMGLDVKDLVILKYILILIDSKRSVKRVIAEKEYSWIKISSIQKNLEILNFKGRTSVWKRIKKLTSNGILEQITIRENGTFSFFCKGVNLSKLVDDGFQKSGYIEKRVEVLSEKEREIREKDGEEISNEKDYEEKEVVCKASIEYLNDVTGATFNSNSKYSKELILRLFDEGYSYEDIKMVIDKKAFEWKNTDMQGALKPSVLFKVEKFEEYLNSPSKYLSGLDKEFEQKNKSGYKVYTAVFENRRDFENVGSE